MHTAISAALAAIVTTGLAGTLGCAPTSRPAGAGTAIANLPDTPSQNLERLRHLDAARRAAEEPGDYLLGPGDLLAVQAVGLEELTQRVRVDADGGVTLPLLGSVRVGGLSVSGAQQELTWRLGQFMYQPHVTVFVEEYRSQQVGVVGAVQRPGLVSLTARRATVLDALSAAGGMTPEAGGRIYLVPGESRPTAPEGIVPAALHADAAASVDADGGAPIMVDLKELGQSAQTLFFGLPVRAGDVVMVPGAGEFIVAGWVAKPGNYPLKSSLTLRGAIATAGGVTFPADTTRVRVHRLTPAGDGASHDVDYQAIVNQQAADVFVHDGDVIEVRASTIRSRS
jgi:polysaccharide export outer membrane protein